ncbi:MAG: hypothetical protein JWO11_3608 [Nocardioides sp.]|nr:hypothetical protein [Nocardioides sp.]
MSIVRIALVTGACIGALSLGLAIGHAHRPTDTAPAPVVAVQPAQEHDEAPVTYLGEDDPIVPLVCGVNLNCSDVDRMAAAKPKGKGSTTVRTSHSSNGASSTTVTRKAPAGSTTTRVSRSAKGVTTTSTTTTVSH